MYGKRCDRAIDNKLTGERRPNDRKPSKQIYFFFGFLLLPAAAFLSSLSSACTKHENKR